MAEVFDHENRIYTLEGNIRVLRDIIKEYLDNFGILIYKIYEEIKKLEDD